METDTATSPELALSDTDICWDRLDKGRFHITGAILFTAQSALIHPTAVVKTRMQVAAASSGFSHMTGLSVFKHILKNDGIPGIFRGFGTSAIGSLPGRVLALTSLEICQRLMVQGVPGSKLCNGTFDVIRTVMKDEGVRGMYRGFGLTAVYQSPASALWWGAYATAQHIIWRSLDYSDDMGKKPSHMEMVTVQATAGMLAGACSSVVTTPIDTVKTRLQVMDEYGVGRPSVMKTTKILLQEEGWRGFYRGFGPREIISEADVSTCMEWKDSVELKNAI
nr:solute carrier family 25 member 44-like isoform X1 [Ipomoea batatas]GME06254.1 solute carrier family 25 member 44-like isoform X1 [Ipomoea batatas]